MNQVSSISHQGKKCGNRIVFQRNFWSNTTKTSKYQNLNPNAPLPLSPDNVLGVIDTFDVPLKVEKLGIQASAIKAANSTKNIIFINHVKQNE